MRSNPCVLDQSQHCALWDHESSDSELIELVNWEASPVFLQTTLVRPWIKWVNWQCESVAVFVWSEEEKSRFAKKIKQTLSVLAQTDTLIHWALCVKSLFETSWVRINSAVFWLSTLCVYYRHAPLSNANAVSDISAPPPLFRLKHIEKRIFLLKHSHPWDLVEVTQPTMKMHSRYHQSEGVKVTFCLSLCTLMLQLLWFFFSCHLFSAFTKCLGISRIRLECNRHITSSVQRRKRISDSHRPLYRKSLSNICVSEEKKSRQSWFILIWKRKNCWSILFKHSLWPSGIRHSTLEREG